MLFIVTEILILIPPLLVKFYADRDVEISMTSTATTLFQNCSDNFLRERSLLKNFVCSLNQTTLLA